MSRPRTALSKRLRFEIFKRDNHRCRYCGAGVIDSVLHVDHVVPFSKGGSDDPSNLVTACRDCNGGKSDVPLEERKLKARFTSEEEREHAEQLREYLAVQREIAGVKREAEALVLERWQELMGEWPARLPGHLPRAVKGLGIESVIQAVEAVARKEDLRRDQDRIRYFCGVLRNMREERATSAPSSDEEENVSFRDGLAEAITAYWNHRLYHGLFCSVPNPMDALAALIDDGDVSIEYIYRLIDKSVWSDKCETADDIQDIGVRSLACLGRLAAERPEIEEGGEFSVHQTFDQQTETERLAVVASLKSLWRAAGGGDVGSQALFDSTMEGLLSKSWYYQGANIQPLQQLVLEAVSLAGTPSSRLSELRRRAVGCGIHFGWPLEIQWPEVSEAPAAEETTN